MAGHGCSHVLGTCSSTWEGGLRLGCSHREVRGGQSCGEGSWKTVGIWQYFRCKREIDVF